MLAKVQRQIWPVECNRGQPGKLISASRSLRFGKF